MFVHILFLFAHWVKFWAAGNCVWDGPRRCDKVAFLALLCPSLFVAENSFITAQCICLLFVPVRPDLDFLTLVFSCTPLSSVGLESSGAALSLRYISCAVSSSLASLDHFFLLFHVSVLCSLVLGVSIFFMLWSIYASKQTYWLLVWGLLYSSVCLITFTYSFQMCLWLEGWEDTLQGVCFWLFVNSSPQILLFGGLMSVHNFSALI